MVDTQPGSRLLSTQRDSLVCLRGRCVRTLIQSFPRLYSIALRKVFEAADKEVTDEEVGKKGGKKTGGDAKDPAEAMGDMLSSFFGGGKK